MSEQDTAGVRDPDGPDARGADPEAAEDYAETLPVDPTHDQIDTYLQMEGDRPLGEQR